MDGTPEVPRFRDETHRSIVRGALSSAGFDEDEICRRLGLGRWEEIWRLGRWDFLSRAERAGPPLAVLLGLFRMGSEAEADELRAVLGGAAVEAMLASGLLAERGGRLRAQVMLTALGDQVFASDRADRHATRASDFVLGAGAVTRRLADFTDRRPVDTGLDLGCGAGFLAGLAAGHARRVVATDVNPRAVGFARFNAELNGLAHVECKEGSLFEPVRGERFDLIVCNPPYALSPAETYTYRDGGPSLSRSIVRGAADHLTPAGLLLMLVEWPERVGSDWWAEPEEWLQGGRCDSWLLRLYTHDADAYASQWLGQEYQDAPIPQEVHRTWVENLRGRGVSSVGGGLLALRPARRPEPHRHFRDAPPVVAPSGAMLGRWLDGQELLLGLEEEGRLLDTPLAPSPDLERRDVGKPTGDGWESGPTELRLTRGFTFGARVDPVAAAVVGLLDGTRTPRAALERFAAQHGVSTGLFLADLPAALRHLVDLGLLGPVD